MDSLLSAELAATCSALGYYDEKSNKYYADSNTLETVKDLIRYLRRDGESHEIRRQLGETKVLQTDLLPLLKNYWEETDLFDVLVRLLVNLTTPALVLWNEEIPSDRTIRNHYLQIEDHLQSYKETFADETFWGVLSTRLSKILETDSSERGEENSLIIERILILIRNILQVAPDPTTEKRADNDANSHDQVLFALHQSGILDIILYISSSVNERAYYMHTLEILSFMLREQKASELATAALQRSETEKVRDEAELLAIRFRETNQKQQKQKMYTGARHSRFGGTFVLKSMKSISDNELIYHKPLNKLDALNFDADKKKPKTPKNRLPVQSSSLERRSTFAIRLFLKEFCVEFLNGAYNTLMYYVKDNLVRARAQTHDESYYLWAMRFFMEFNRCYKFEVKLVSETMSVQTMRYVQQLMETYFDMISSDKKKVRLWSRRLHLALLAYRELLLTICAMDKSPDGTVRDSAKVIKSNIFYILEYREFILTLLFTYDELKLSDVYLKDLMETQHIFLKMLESFCGNSGSVVVLKKAIKKRVPKKPLEASASLELLLEARWEEVGPQLSSVLEGNMDLEEVAPFDAASELPIDEQKSEAMKKVQRALRSSQFESAIGILRAAREVWPENDCFGSNNMAVEEEFLALRDIFFANLGENAPSSETVPEEQPIYGDHDEEEEEEQYQDYGETDFKFEDLSKRLANPKIVRACGLALKNFETNSVNTNHCIIKLLHRIAFDCKQYVIIFQVSILMTFQRIYANKEFPQYRELVKFATYIIRQFMRVANDNKKLYMEALFWKNSSEAYRIEYGYDESGPKTKLTTWGEEQEDELRRLFMEHQQNQVQDDILDWISNNLIDNSRTRLAIKKKLKELCLLVDPKKKGAAWSEEQSQQLQSLYEQFSESDDPVGLVMKELVPKRSRPLIVTKLLQMGLIQDRSQGRKPTKAGKSRSQRMSSMEDASEDDVGCSEAPRRRPPPSLKVVSLPHLTKLVVQLIDSGMSEALDWLKESFSDAVEDFECDDGNNEGIPLVPIMDYSVEAMENQDFQKALKAFGITEPFDEQESYWRIPGHVPVDALNNYISLLQQGIDKTLIIPEETEPIPENGDSSGDDEDVFDNIRQYRVESVPEIASQEEFSTISENETVKQHNVSSRRILDSESDEDVQENESTESKRDRDDSGSDVEKPIAKKSRFIISDDED